MHSMRLCLSNYMNVPAHFTRDALHRVCKSFSIQTYLQVLCLCGNELSEELKQNGRLQLYIFYFFQRSQLSSTQCQVLTFPTEQNAIAPLIASTISSHLYQNKP